MLLPSGVLAQPNLPKEEADSLWGVWKNENLPDTARIEAIAKYAWDGYVFTKPDSAFYYAQLQYELAKDKGLKSHMAWALNTQGVSFAIRGDYSKAIGYYTKSLKIKEEIGNQKAISSSLSNIGMIYKNQGNYAKAIDYYTRSLKIDEEVGNQHGIASTFNNIGMIYKFQGDYATAIDYYQRSLNIEEELGKKQGVANCLNNLGNIYADQSNSAFNAGNISLAEEKGARAIEYYSKSLKIREEAGDKKGISHSLHNLGSIYDDQHDYDQAIEYYTKSLAIREEIGDKRGMSNTLNNMGNIYGHQGNYTRALDYGNRALIMAQDVGAAIEIKSAAKSLWKINKKLGRHQKALDMYELYVTTRDSIQSEENQKEVIRQEYKYQYEKQAALDSVTHAKERNLAEATIARQIAESEKKDIEIKARRNQQYALFGGLGLLFIFGLFMYNRFRVTRKQKSMIERQKGEVEKQKVIIEMAHQEITDSIHYAKRIQSAILPPQKVVNQHLPASFILYKPKDVVAGDFYWLEPVSLARAGEQGVLFAAADCTGHGVPGAMVSVVCNNALNRSVREYGLTDPGKILDKTREIVTSEFEKSEEEVKDGMDIALCALYKTSETWILEYSGANNPLWIVSRRKIPSTNSVDLSPFFLNEVKADKQPIGRFDNPKPYTTHTFELEEGDTVYVFSDGFADQFGGEKGKKFKAANMKRLVLSIQNNSMEEQCRLMDEAFEDWKRDLEQLDDVCVIGVRI